MTLLIYKGQNVSVDELKQMLDWFFPRWRSVYGNSLNKFALVDMLQRVCATSSLAKQFFGDDLVPFRITLLRWLTINGF